MRSVQFYLWRFISLAVIAGRRWGVNLLTVGVMLTILLFPGGVEAKVFLPAFFSDNMVLQQKDEVAIWGRSDKRGKINVTTSWDNQRYTTAIHKDGKWRVEVKTPVAGGPYTLVIDDGEKTELKNILIGEVWLCSGQSNMEMPMKGFKGQPVENSNMDILRSGNPQLRLFTVKRHSVAQPQEDVSGSWQEAAPEAVRDFSATAYYFGRLLQEQLGIPVGLIMSAWGGSPAESWMSKEMLSAFPELQAKIPATDEAIKVKNRTPSTLYNGMIHPLLGYGIKGCIWYQGESNYENPGQYVDLFSTLIRSWRKVWGRDEFPFYYCQIAPYEYGLITEKGKDTINSAFLREAQLKVAQQMPNVGMAVLMDAGYREGIHPTNKRTAGERLALLALVKQYGIKGVAAEGPVYKSMEVKNDTVVLSFDQDKMWVTAKNGQLMNFKIAGADRKFYPARAWLNRSKVCVKSNRVKQPVAVRYAFENYADGDLFGTEGLPVSSFRTDDWQDKDSSGDSGAVIPE